MSEDLAKRSPDQRGHSDELFRPIQSISMELSELEGTVDARLNDTRAPAGRRFRRIYLIFMKGGNPCVKMSEMSARSCAT
jgi:hypothetical protein